MRTAITIIILAGLLILAVWALTSGVRVYNDFVPLDQAVQKQWGQVENVYQRRFDLIPNLAAATSGYMKHEQKVFKDIADARTKYAGFVNIQGADVGQKMEAMKNFDGAMGNFLGRLMVIMENYPNLKADKTVATLMAELAGTENRIAVERKRYNDVAEVFNTKLQKFPGLIFKWIGFFDFKSYFKAELGADKAPKIDLTK